MLSGNGNQRGTHPRRYQSRPPTIEQTTPQHHPYSTPPPSTNPPPPSAPYGLLPNPYVPNHLQQPQTANPYDFQYQTKSSGHDHTASDQNYIQQQQFYQHGYYPNQSDWNGLPSNQHGYQKIHYEQPNFHTPPFTPRGNYNFPPAKNHMVNHTKTPQKQWKNGSLGVVGESGQNEQGYNKDNGENPEEHSFKLSFGAENETSRGVFVSRDVDNLATTCHIICQETGVKTSLVISAVKILDTRTLPLHQQPITHENLIYADFEVSINAAQLKELQKALYSSSILDIDLAETSTTSDATASDNGPDKTEPTLELSKIREENISTTDEEYGIAATAETIVSEIEEEIAEQQIVKNETENEQYDDMVEDKVKSLKEEQVREKEHNDQVLLEGRVEVAESFEEPESKTAQSSEEEEERNQKTFGPVEEIVYDEIHHNAQSFYESENDILSETTVMAVELKDQKIGPNENSNDSPDSEDNEEDQQEEESEKDEEDEETEKTEASTSSPSVTERSRRGSQNSGPKKKSKRARRNEEKRKRINQPTAPTPKETRQPNVKLQQSAKKTGKKWDASTRNTIAPNYITELLKEHKERKKELGGPSSSTRTNVGVKAVVKKQPSPRKPPNATASRGQVARKETPVLRPGSFGNPLLDLQFAGTEVAELANIMKGARIFSASY